MLLRRKLNKTTVNYREATGKQQCWNCAMFHKGKPTGTCDLVRGVIRPADTCDRWVAR